MRRLRTLNRALGVAALSLSVIAALPSVAASANPVSAQGVGPGNLTLCNTAGHGGAVAKIPGRHYATRVVPNNLCNTFYLGGNTNEPIYFYVEDGNQLFAWTIYNGTSGMTATVTVDKGNLSLVALPG